MKYPTIHDFPFHTASAPRSNVTPVQKPSVDIRHRTSFEPTKFFQVSEINEVLSSQWSSVLDPKISSIEQTISDSDRSTNRRLILEISRPTSVALRNDDFTLDTGASGIPQPPLLIFPILQITISPRYPIPSQSTTTISAGFLNTRRTNAPSSDERSHTQWVYFPPAPILKPPSTITNSPLPTINGSSLAAAENTNGASALLTFTSRPTPTFLFHDAFGVSGVSGGFATPVDTKYRAPSAPRPRSLPWIHRNKRTNRNST